MYLFRALLFLLFVVVMMSKVSSLPNCSRSAKPYDGKVSSGYFGNIGRGYDPKGVRPDDQGFQGMVFTLTNTSDTFKLPGSPTTQVDLPCEASELARAIPGGDGNSISQVMRNFSEFEKKSETSGSFGVGFLNFLSSMGYSSSVTELLKRESVSVFEYRSYLQADTSLPVVPPEDVQSWWNPDFGKAVNRLHPNNYNDSSYLQLIDAFGTHVVTRLVIGRYISRSAKMEYCDYERVVNMQASGSASAASDELVDDLNAKAKFKMGLSTKTVNTKFSSSIFRKMRGGNETAFLKTGDLDKYVASTTGQTGIVDRGTRFVEIWTLLPTSDKRRDLLKQAIYNYLATMPKPATTKPQCSAGPQLQTSFASLAFFVAILVSVIC